MYLISTFTPSSYISSLLIKIGLSRFSWVPFSFFGNALLQIEFIELFYKTTREL